jgi:hypothetical protein
LTVVDVGSFAGTARKLGRATSVIGHSIFYFGNAMPQEGFRLSIDQPNLIP